MQREMGRRCEAVLAECRGEIISLGRQSPLLEEHKKRRSKKLFEWHTGHANGEIMHWRGITLCHSQEVFSPFVGEGTELLADVIAGVRNVRALEVGTGSGVLSIMLALNGCEVVATDVSDAAVTAARRNAALNGVSDRIVVRKGDLFRAIEGETGFRVIVFNPPFMDGDAGSNLERAVFDRGYGTLCAFLGGVRQRLSEEGCCLLAFSNVGNTSRLLEMMEAEGLICEVVAKQKGALNFFVLRVW